MRSYGEPGGIYLTYALDLDRGEYVVRNESGDELFANGSEQAAQGFCAGLIVKESEAAAS